MTKRRHLTWIALLIVFALTAAACGGDDDDGADGAEDASAETTDDGGGDDTEPADDGDDDTADDDDDGSGDDDAEPADDGDTEATDDGGDEPATGDDGEAVELTASFRGVTADTITLGITTIDFETLNEQFGLDLAFANFGPAYEAVVDWYNDQGGVNGRQMELVIEEYLPVGAATADAACLVLTEDNDVFAVLGGFLGPSTESVNDCIVGVHETLLVGPAPTAEQQATYGGFWISPEMGLERRNTAFVNLLAESGQIDELGPIMIIGGDPAAEGQVAEMAADFAAAGADVRLETVVTTAGDTQATNAEVDVFVERARTDGVETVVLLGEAENRNIHIFEVAPEFTYLVPNGDRITDWESITPEGLQPGTVVLSSNSEIRPGEDPVFDECTAAIEERLGVEVIDPANLPEGDTNYWSGTFNACTQVAMFVQVATEAGADLTQDSWIAALDTVELSVPGFGFSSLSGTKTDASNTLRLVNYNLDTLTFEPLTDRLDVG